ncbi:MAG: MerR family transcriptional regulator [Pseudomonadota bacterium]
MAKSKDAFRTIGEVSEWLDTPSHVIRFWESKFEEVNPVQRQGGRRYFRPEDLLFLGGLKQLLHVDGNTIKGVQKMIDEKGPEAVTDLSPALPDTDATPEPPSPAPPARRQRLGDIEQQVLINSPPDEDSLPEPEPMPEETAQPEQSATDQLPFSFETETTPDPQASEPAMDMPLTLDDQVAELTDGAAVETSEPSEPVSILEPNHRWRVDIPAAADRAALTAALEDLMDLRSELANQIRD